MKKTAKLHLIPNAPSNSVQASKARKGNDKVAAGRKAVVKAGVGLEVVKAWRGSQLTVMAALNVYAKQNQATMLQAIEEVKVEREADQKACGSLKFALNKRKYQSVAANYSRLLRVMQAIQKGIQVDKILAASNVAQAAAFIPPKTKGTDTGPKAFTESNVTNWLGKAKRILPLDMVRKGTGKTADDAEKEALSERIAMLEKAFTSILAELARPAVANLSALPVGKIVELAKGKQAKAA